MENIYIAPDMEVLSVAVEKGYASSGNGGGDDEGMNTPTVGGF